MTLELPRPINPNPFRGGRPKLGVDVAVASLAFRRLRQQGVDVLYEAATAEPDEVWFGAAVRAGVHCIVSPDGDLERLCAGIELPFIRFPQRQGFHWRRQSTFILDKLRRWGWLHRGRAPHVRGRLL